MPKYSPEYRGKCPKDKRGPLSGEEVAQGVELSMRQVVALLELREPLRRRGGVHRLAVRLALNLFLDLFFGHIRLRLVRHRAADLPAVLVVPARYRDEIALTSF